VGNQVYVHRPYFDKQLDDPFSKESRNAYRNAWDIASNYLREMNVSEGMIEKMLTTSSVDGSKLSQNELNMMEYDPVYEELEIRECGPRNKKFWKNLSRAEINEIQVRNDCITKFLNEHADRMKSNAQNFIRINRRATPQHINQDISGAWSFVAECKNPKTGKRFKSTGHLTLALYSDGQVTGNIRIPNQSEGVVRDGRLDSRSLRFENAYNVRSSRETVEVWEGNLSPDGKMVSGRISASGSFSYGCDFEATR